MSVTREERIWYGIIKDVSLFPLGKNEGKLSKPGLGGVELRRGWGRDVELWTMEGWMNGEVTTRGKITRGSEEESEIWTTTSAKGEKELYV